MTLNERLRKCTFGRRKVNGDVPIWVGRGTLLRVLGSAEIITFSFGSVTVGAADGKFLVQS